MPTSLGRRPHLFAQLLIERVFQTLAPFGGGEHFFPQVRAGRAW